MEYKDLIKYLNDNKDLKYKEFNKKIVNTNYEMIGVRTPILKSLAKTIQKEDCESFLQSVTSNTYEEVLLEGIVISNFKDAKKLYNLINKFIEKIDNWAICDLVCSNMKILNKNIHIAEKLVSDNINSDNPWRVRFAFVIMLNYLIDKEHLKQIFNYIENDKNDFYYIMMAKAWLISMCFIKYKQETHEYLKTTKIDNITYNKAISKICDSYKVSEKDKILLKNMKKK